MRRVPVLAAAALVAAFFFMPAEAAREPLPDSVSLFRNSPPVVEQQYKADGVTRCGSQDTTCVTNAGPAMWDADDTWRVSVYDGEWEGLLFADWVQHDFYIWACRKPERGRWATPLYATIAFSPQNRRSENRTFTDAFATSKQQECVRGCATSPDYDRELDRDLLQEIPNQGGGGSVLGFAVPTTVRVTSNGTVSLTASLDTVDCK